MIFDFSLSKLSPPERILKLVNFLISVDPKFSAPVSNITVPVSRDAILVCKVHDLYQYKVSQIVEQLKVKTEIITKE